MADPPTPRLPDPSKRRSPRTGGGNHQQANAATFAALFGLGLIAASFIAMVALVLPQVRGLILVAFAAIGFFAVHYVLWGWWLPKLTKGEDEAE